MGKIVEFFLNRPMLVNLIIIVIIGLGIKSVYEARKEGFPEISLNKIIIQTIYPGSSAGDVEINITVPIENALDEVEGIKEVLSVSAEGMSRVEVQADDSATPGEFRDLYSDIENVLSEIDNLPGDIDGKPSMSEFTSSDIPVMEIAYTGSYEKLKPYIDNLEGKIKKLPGISNVDVIGLPDEEVRILVDPLLARKHMVGLRMIYNAVKKRNLEGSGGTLESFLSEKKIVLLNKFRNYEDVMDTNIIMSPDGFGIKLRQVAKLKVVPEDKKLIVRNNGKRGAALCIRKTGSGDLIKTINNVNRLLKNENLPEGVEMKVLLDQSRLTRDRISLLVGNALMGFILVVVVLLIIFDIRTAVWTAFGIPFTLFGMFIFLNSQGLSLNLISLGGFIIILGMLVDDAIVIAEEISGNKEKGMSPKEAAVTAVKKMWMPVTAACLTTMVAFSPLFYLGGFPGKFIWAIPLMVIVGLVISLFESFFILPVHLSHGETKKTEKKAFVRKIEMIYEKVLIKALKFRYIVLAVLIIIFMMSAFSIMKFANKDPFPQDAAEGFSINVTLPPGAPSGKTRDNVRKIENLLLELPKNEIIGFSTRIGTQSGLGNTERGTQLNIAIIFVYLEPFSERGRTAVQIMKTLEDDAAKIIDTEKIKCSYDLKRLGPPMGKPFEIRVISNNDKSRTLKEQEIVKFLATVEGVADIDTDEIGGKNELNIDIDHDILSRAGLNVEDVLTTLRIAFDGMIVTDLTTVDRKLDFRLRLNRLARGDINFIDSLPIVNSRGRLINLKSFISLKEQPSRAEVHHVDGKRSTTVFGSTDIQVISPVEVMEKVKLKFPSDGMVTIAYSGQPVETELIFSGLSLAALIALAGIYLLIALMFNSYAKPFIIMLSLPFMVVGLAFVLITHGIPMSMMTGMAMVGLMGVIVNDSIVMVHTVHDISGTGEITSDVIIKGAVSRLRPVLLTTITTILGVLPTGYGLGGFDPFLSHMSLTLAYGLLFGTGIILLIVPVLFHVGTDLKHRFARYV